MKPIGELRDWCLVLLFSVAVLLSGGCGVKGPPVAPEDLFPDTTGLSIENEDDDDDEQELGSY